MMMMMLKYTAELGFSESIRIQAALVADRKRLLMWRVKVIHASSTSCQRDWTSSVWQENGSPPPRTPTCEHLAVFTVDICKKRYCSIAVNGSIP